MNTTSRSSYFNLRNHTDLGALLLILVLAASVRVFNLNLLGPFIDESGHIDLALRYDYVPLYERIAQGKVLGYILFYPTAQWAQDPLLATRLLIAVIGIFTTAGIFLVGQRLAGQTAAVLAGLIWAISPFVVFHDRLALHDPFVSLFLAWALFLLIDAIKCMSRARSFLAGLLLSLATLTKVYAGIGGVWLIIIGIAIIERKNIRNYMEIVIASGVGFTLPLLLTAVYLYPVLDLFIQMRQTYIAHFLSAPQGMSTWQLLATNLSTIGAWIGGYDSNAFGCFLLMAFVLAAFQPSKEKIALLLVSVITIFVFAVSFVVWFPRYFLPSLIPLSLLIGVAGADLSRQTQTAWSQKTRGKWLSGMVTVLMSSLFVVSFFAWLTTDLILQTNPSQAQIPALDRYQYFDGWPSGIGVGETVTFLDTLTSSAENAAPVLVITGGFGRHGFWSVPLQMRGNPNIQFRNLDIRSETDLRKLVDYSAQQRTLILLEYPLVIIPQQLVSLVDPAPTLIFEYKRSRAEGGFQIYELNRNARIVEASRQ